jgi:hypothetical protein
MRLPRVRFTLRRMMVAVEIQCVSDPDECRARMAGGKMDPE